MRTKNSGHLEIWDNRRSGILEFWIVCCVAVEYKNSDKMMNSGLLDIYDFLDAMEIALNENLGSSLSS